MIWAINRSSHLLFLKVGARTLSPVTQTVEQLAKLPLVLFLEALTRAPAAEYERATGFPPTLKDLVLRDHYHRVFPSLHQLIAKAIPSHGNLRYVELRLLVDLDAQKIHMNLELPQDDIRMTVQSWNQFSSNEKVKVSYQYQSASTCEVDAGVARLTSPLPDFDHEDVGNIAEILDLAVEDPGTRGNCYRRTRVWKRDGVLEDFLQGMFIINRSSWTGWERSDHEDLELAGAMWALELE